jgi:beta-glucanase (GH16 family)
MSRWRVVLGAVIVLAIGIWDVGLPGHSASPGTAAAKPSASASPAQNLSAPVVPDVAGVIHPKGAAEFNATFTGSRLDTSVWDTCYPWMDQRGCMNFDNARTELEWYLPSQDQVYGGALHLVAQSLPTAGRSATGAPKEYACRSGMVTSDRGFQFEYGYIQVVAQIPATAGLWGALWLDPANFGWPPEIDILEAWGGPLPYAGSFFHYRSGTRLGHNKAVLSPATKAFGWHTFALSWTKTQMTWLLDGKVELTVRQHVPHQQMFFIANLAEAVSPAQPNVGLGDCDGKLLIRSVKVWKP